MPSRPTPTGDSTTAGFGAVTRADAWPRRLATLLASRGGRETNLFSDHNLAASYDPRMVRSAGWSKNSSKTLGGFFWLNSTTDNAMTFTPQASYDTVELFGYGAQAITVTIGSGTPVSFTTAGGSVLTKKTLTCAEAGLDAGAWPIAVTRNGAAVFCGLNAFDAATGIDVMNVGTSGWKVAEFSGSAFSASAGISLIAPDLTIINVGINDFNQVTPTTEAAFKAGVQTLIDRGKISGDVMLVIPNDTGAVHAANRTAFAQYLRDVATLNGLVAPLDLAAALGSYAAADTAGDMLDSLHPSAQGHGKIAVAVHRSIA